jgi:mRNA interferase MazF
MDRAEVWWADLPSPVGRRPVLIVTRSAAVAVRNQVVVAQVTRTAHGLPCEVPLTQADGMPQDSFTNCDVLLTVPKSRLTRRITLLGATKMRDINNALKFAMEIP